MKKTLMSIVFGVLAMVLMIGGAKAAGGPCVLAPGEASNTCPASVGGVGANNVATALTALATDGGEITMYQPLHIANATSFNVTSDMTINMYGDNLLTIGNASNVLTVKNGGKLTINGTNVTITKQIVVEKGGELVINATKVDATAGGLVTTNGKVTISADTTIDATAQTAITANANSVVELNGTITAATIAEVSSTAASIGDSNAEVTVAGGNYEATDIAFKAANKGVIVINGGTINATEQAIRIADGVVTINGGNLTSTNSNTIVTAGTAATAELDINGGTIVSTAANKVALALNNANATYHLTGGVVESKGTETAAAIRLGAAFFDATTGELISTQEGIITGGKYLNKIVAEVINSKTSLNMDVSTQLVAEGVAITTADGYKVVGEGEKTTEPGATEGENNGEVTAPESQGNTADAKNPDTSDNVYGLISMAVASVAGLFVTFKKTILG